MSNDEKKHEILSPEETIDVELAGFWCRAGAIFLDISLLNIIITLVVVAVAAIFVSHENAGHHIETHLVLIVINGIVIFIPFLYFISFWLKKQATLGKMLANIKVVDARTLKKPSFSQCLMRFTGMIFSMLTLGGGFIYMVRDPKGQCLHDKMAGTLVIRDRD